MRKNVGTCVVLVFLLSRTILGQSAEGSSPAQIIARLADHLVGEQVQSGSLAGSWPEEGSSSAGIACGLVGAYESTGDIRYREAAELAATYFVRVAEGSFMGDETYTLIRLSETVALEAQTRYRQTVRNFYADVKEYAAGSTAGYISEFAQIDPSTAVFYLAHHAVAAYRADAVDRSIWRQGLVEFLAMVDDTSAACPVMALGIATWALAQTGPLDDTPVSRSQGGSGYWQGHALRDLPGLLAGHQVGPEGISPGSFYWRFDHGDMGEAGLESGYTEDLVFGVLGLVAAKKACADSDCDVDAAIDAGQAALLQAMETLVTAQVHLWLPSADSLVCSGEVLTCISSLVSAEDTDLDGQVDVVNVQAGE